MSSEKPCLPECGCLCPKHFEPHQRADDCQGEPRFCAHGCPNGPRAPQAEEPKAGCVKECKFTPLELGPHAPTVYHAPGCPKHGEWCKGCEKEKDFCICKPAPAEAPKACGACMEWDPSCEDCLRATPLTPAPAEAGKVEECVEGCLCTCGNILAVHTKGDKP